MYTTVSTTGSTMWLHVRALRDSRVNLDSAYAAAKPLVDATSSYHKGTPTIHLCTMCLCLCKYMRPVRIFLVILLRMFSGILPTCAGQSHKGAL